MTTRVPFRATRLWIPLLLLTVVPAEARQLTAEERSLTRPESDALPRQPHGPLVDPPPTAARGFEEVRRYPAAMARQGVAVDAEHFYVVSNFHLGKYDRATGTLQAEWRTERGGEIVHLNSCVVHEAKLVCAHSNYPGIPMLSSIEVWDTRTLEHLESRSFGVQDGSLTWAVRHDGDWWLHFAHYGHHAGEPGKGPEWSTLVRFDDAWNRKAAFAYPVSLIQRMTPFSASGGNWGEDGRLYVSGHDEMELYALRMPAAGSVLAWVETIPAPMHGQAWVFDPQDPDVVWGIIRSTREVVVGRRRR